MLTIVENRVCMHASIPHITKLISAGDFKKKVILYKSTKHQTSHKSKIVVEGESRHSTAFIVSEVGKLKKTRRLKTYINNDVMLTVLQQCSSTSIIMRNCEIVRQG